jgi:hypothetical protein
MSWESYFALVLLASFPDQESVVELIGAYFFGFTLESLTFFGVTVEYFRVQMSTFEQLVLISFRSYGGMPNGALPDKESASSVGSAGFGVSRAVRKGAS